MNDLENKFIVIEGIDGAGTEVQSKRLAKFLGESGKRILYPDYDGPIGRMIHNFLHEKFELSPDMQLLLYGADMVKDKENIEKALSSGKTIVADRYFTSAVAYQNLKGVPMEKILEFAKMFEIVKPDIAIYLDVSVETSIERKYGEKKGNLDRHEANKEFLEKITKKYKQLIKDQTYCKWVTVDGEKSKEGVFEEIKKTLKL